MCDVVSTRVKLVGTGNDPLWLQSPSREIRPRMAQSIEILQKGIVTLAVSETGPVREGKILPVNPSSDQQSV